MEPNPQENILRAGRIAELYSRAGHMIPACGRVTAILLVGLVLSRVSGSFGQDQFTPKPKGTTTFYGDVLPIYERACLRCHYPKGPAPFDLGDYRSAAPRALTSSYIAVRRQMPISDGASDFGHLGSGPTLTQRELLTIKQWADEGAIKGVSRKARYPLVPEFDIGVDQVLTLRAAKALPADGAPAYVDMPFKVSRTLSGAYTGFSLSNKNGFFCRHAALLGKSGTVATAALGYRPLDLKEPAGFYLAAGDELVVRVRFHPTGSGQPTQVRIGLRRAKTPVLPLDDLVLDKTSFTVPAGERAFKVKTEKTLEKRALIASIVPHVSYLATRLSVVATPIGGQPRVLLSIPEWSFLNGGAYNFSKPVLLNKGTRLTAEFTFDNSTSNSLNPLSPPKETRSGIGVGEPSCRVELLCLAKG